MGQKKYSSFNFLWLVHNVDMEKHHKTILLLTVTVLYNATIACKQFTLYCNYENKTGYSEVMSRFFAVKPMLSKKKKKCF